MRNTVYIGILQKAKLLQIALIKHMGGTAGGRLQVLFAHVDIDLVIENRLADIVE